LGGRVKEITQYLKVKSPRFASLIWGAGGEKTAQNHKLKVKTYLGQVIGYLDLKTGLKP
jgi:hypothetical protein